METVAELKDWLKLAESTLTGAFSENKISQEIYDQLKSKLNTVSKLIDQAKHDDGSFAGAAGIVEAAQAATNFVSEAADTGVTITDLP